MESVLEPPTATQAETPAGETTKAKKAKKPTPPPPDVKPLIKQLDQMRRIGEAIREKDAELATQNAVIATVKSKLETERDTGHEMERELEELHSDLAKLSVGGFVDRLPFPDVPKTAKSSGTTASAGSTPATKTTPAADPEAWRAVTLADVWRESGANVSLLALLADGKIKAGPRKGQIAEIRTLGDLATFTSHPHAKLTDIAGVGPEKAAAVENAVDSYWAKHPQGLTAAAPAPLGNVAAEPTTPAALVWETDEKDASVIFAPNTAGVETEADLLAEFVVRKQADDVFVIDESEDTLLPMGFPEIFPNLDAAKLYCQARNDDLCAKVDELFLGTDNVCEVARLGLAVGSAEAACYSNLLAWLGNDAPVNVDRFLTIRGNRYLVTLAPGGHPADVYALRQILSEADGKSVKAEDANPYAGKTVIIDAKPNTIAGSSGTMLVRDAGTKAKAEAEPEAPAEDASAKKPKGGGKAKATSKKPTPKKKTTVKK